MPSIYLEEVQNHQGSLDSEVSTSLVIVTLEILLEDGET